MKQCIKCLESKPTSEFHKDKTKIDGLVSSCKPCKKLYRANYYTLNSEDLKAYSSAYAKENPEAHKARVAKWVEENRDKHLANRSAYFAKRYHGDHLFSANYKLRAMLRRVLMAAGENKDLCTFEAIGYTADQLVQRLSVNMRAGMTWDNFGDWEIDHKIPVSVFLSRGETRPRIINALSNLQPLWKEENRSKGARYVG